MRGRERGHADGFLVHLAIQRGQLIVVDTETTALSSEIASLSLDEGEKQVSSLALRDQADLVLLDDLKARGVAQSYGLSIKGTLGVLVSGYRHGFLPLDDVQMLIEAIIARDDIGIAEELCRRVLISLKAAV